MRAFGALRARIAGRLGFELESWDLTALLNAADPRAPLAERHLWLARLFEWLRHAPAPRGDAEADSAATPRPVLRLKHLLNVLDKHPEHRARVRGVVAAFWREIDAVALLADFGFAPRQGLLTELGERLRQRFVPLTVATTDLAELFGLLFADPRDADWLRAIDDATLSRLMAAFSGLSDGDAQAEAGPPAGRDWRTVVADAVVFLSLQVAAAGLLGPVRQRMSAQALRERPFDQLVGVAERLRAAALAGDETRALQEAQLLRGVLDACRRAAHSVREHLEEHGVSIGLLFQMDQLRGRVERIESLLAGLLAPAGSAERHRESLRLVAALVEAADERRSVRALFARQYSMLARKVAERSAETGEHYITRSRDEWYEMLRKACGGGAVIAGTTFLKFAILALGLGTFWGGFWAGVNYAACFVLIHLLHWTVATKQPAMTAPAMAAKLEDVSSDEAIEGFVDEVAHLIRSQVAGIVGNLATVVPVVLAVQVTAEALIGRTLVSRHDAEHVLETLSLLGPTPLYAAFTGVLLFASSLIAGWAENWFVLHRIDSAIRWNPRLLALLGAQRAARWADWWRANVSGLAANISLGLLLGIVPVVCAFFSLPIEVRHVTLSTGQIAAALGTLGAPLFHEPAFWWCIAAVPLTGALNLAVSFLCAFKVALRSRGIRLKDRSRIYAAIRRRLRTRFMSFVWPPRRSPAS
ncbi:site-specific recombinase [Caldimonas sp. KR1-144]|uniref:site-specific recombinase n=1 Tax=Caldimonas sp. KR1-144 TaxID=3400911 RepID=UPI003BFF6050